MHSDIPRPVRIARRLLIGAAAFLAINLIVSLAQGLPPASYLIVIALTVLVGVSAGKTLESRAWGLAGGGICLALGALMLLMIPLLQEAAGYAGIDSTVTTTLVISAAIYGGLGIGVIAALSHESTRTHYQAYVPATRALY